MKTASKTAPIQTGGNLPPPSHVAIIMDGNGRWARARGLPRIEGHRRGADAVRNTINAAVKEGVSYLTLFGFSSENWKRPVDEVNDLMGLLKIFLRKEIAELHSNDVCFRVIGNRDKLGNEIVRLIEEAEILTKNNTTLTLTLALSYGGRAELVDACKSIATNIAAGDLVVDDIDEDTISKLLYSNHIPDPDLLIRTSGERRISNFLLWQLAYAEFIFMDILWPDFTEDDFGIALSEYQGRDRRFGGTS